MATFWGLYAPANTPAPVVVRINAELNKAVTSASFQAFVSQNYTEPLPGTPAQFSRQLAQAQAQVDCTFKAIDIQASDAPATNR